MPGVMCRGHQGEYLQSLSPFLRGTASFRVSHWALGPPWSSRIATSQNPFSIRHMEGTVTRNGSLDNQPNQNTDLDVGRPGVQILPCSLSAGKLWSNYLASPSWFSLLQNEEVQAATSQNDSHPRLPKPPDRRQRSPTAQRHFLKTWGAQRRKQPIHPGAAPNAAGSQHPEPSGKTGATWLNIAFHRRGNSHREKGLVRSATWDPQAVALILTGDPE